MCREGSLSGRVALITGASSGIGRALAAELAAGGATLWLTGRNLNTLATVAEGSRAGGVIAADLSDPRQVQGLAEEFARRAGTLDVLIHSAGAIAFGPVEIASATELDYQWQVNVRAPYLLTQELLPLLKTRRGQIVFVNSSAGVRAVAGSGAYSATKHALKGLADSLRAEVNAHGIRVMTVFLGRAATPMQAVVHRYEGRCYRPGELIQPKDIASTIVQALSLPPTVEMTELQLRPAHGS